MRNALLAVPLLAIGTLALAAADAPPKKDPDVEALKTALATYLTTATHPDRPPLPKDLFAEDIVAFWSSGSVYRGRAAMLAACEQATAELERDFEEFRATAKEVEVHRKGDLAWLTCRLVLAGTLTKERGDFERQVRSTFVFEKRDGKWRMVHEHSTRIESR